MQKPEKKIKEYPVSSSAAESIARGLSVIDGFPDSECQFTLAEPPEDYDFWPLAIGCVVNGTGEARTALVALSEGVAIVRERSRAKKVLYRAIGKPCLDTTVDTTTATVYYL